MVVGDRTVRSKYFLSEEVLSPRSQVNKWRTFSTCGRSLNYSQRIPTNPTLCLLDSRPGYDIKLTISQYPLVRSGQ